MKVLITGATGFIGQRVLEQLKLKNIDVVALSNADRIAGIKTISTSHCWKMVVKILRFFYT